MSIGLCRDQAGHRAVLSSSSGSLLFYCLSCELHHLIPGRRVPAAAGCECSRGGAGAHVLLMLFWSLWDASSPGTNTDVEQGRASVRTLLEACPQLRMKNPHHLPSLTLVSCK